MISPTRRTVLKTAALATTSLATPFVRGVHAAGKLSMAFWDHWVPGANDTMLKLCHEWADKEKIDITIDFVTTQGDKLILTAAAEAQAKSGHDIITLLTWYAIGHADSLEPVDELVKSLAGQNGPVRQDAEYLGTQDGQWLAVPASVGCQTKPPCGRIDMLKKFADLDVIKMYPADGPADQTLADGLFGEKFQIPQSAAKSLLMHLSERSSAQQFVAASAGYDLPPWGKLLDFNTWAEEEPPKGTLYNYPPRHPDQIPTVACAPAPKRIANQMYVQATMTKMIAHCTQGGEPINKAVDWAASEIEGFTRM